MTNYFRGALLSLFGTALADTLIWEDQFDFLDFSKWQHEITMGGGGNWEFEWYTNNRTNSFVEDGVLYLQPTLSVENFGDATLHGGDVNIWGGSPASVCTSNAFYGCERNAAASGNVINPVQSARVRSAGKFNFKYGKIEIKAQLPKGDFLWPAIWMLPENEAYGGWPASGEIDIMESRGNDASCAAGGNNKFASTLHWGPAWDANGYEKTTQQFTSDESLADDFHIYGLLWTKDRITTYLDTPDNVVLDVDTSEMSFWERGEWTDRDDPWAHEKEINAPFNQDFYLIMNVAAGGTNGYFPDGQCGKPWSDTDPASVNAFWNSHGAWYSTWDYPATNQAAMKIDSIQVWDLETNPFTQ
jgi:beta-glucanase (GH16 family)